MGYTHLNHGEITRYDVEDADYLIRYQMKIDSGTGFGRLIHLGYGTDSLEIFIGQHNWEGSYRLRYQIGGSTLYNQEYFLITENIFGFGFRF